MQNKEQPAPPEMTFKAVALGLLLALVFGAANAYLGMKAGQTIAATIPAAVIAIAIFRVPALRGGVLEQNIARTAASVGEALVAGAIFTIPAFMMVEMNGVRLWADLRAHYWQSVMILMAGGLIGVFFIVVLRRPLCVEAGLPFPESVASAEVVKAGEAGSDAPKYVFGAMGFAAVLQVLKTDKGLQIFREYAEGFLAFPKSVVHHFDFAKQPIGDVTHGGGIYWSTPNLSPALMGIGYIIGPELAAINASGGFIAWWVLIPLLLFFDPDLPRRLGVGQHRRVGRDLLFGLGITSCGRSRWAPCWWARAIRCSPCAKSIMESLAGAFGASARAAHEGRHLERTDRDIPFQWVAIGTGVLTIADHRDLLLLHRQLGVGDCRGGHHERDRVSAFGGGRVPGGAGGQL